MYVMYVSMQRWQAFKIKLRKRGNVSEYVIYFHSNFGNDILFTRRKYSV